MLVVALLIFIAIGPLAAAAIGTWGVTTGTAILLAVLAVVALFVRRRKPRSSMGYSVPCDDWEPIEYR